MELIQLDTPTNFDRQSLTNQKSNSEGMKFWPWIYVSNKNR